MEEKSLSEPTGGSPGLGNSTTERSRFGVKAWQLFNFKISRTKDENISFTLSLFLVYTRVDKSLTPYLDTKHRRTASLSGPSDPTDRSDKTPIHPPRRPMQMISATESTHSAHPTLIPLKPPPLYTTTTVISHSCLITKPLLSYLFGCLLYRVDSTVQKRKPEDEREISV